MKESKKQGILKWMLMLLLTVTLGLTVQSCSKDNQVNQPVDVTLLVDRVWNYSQENPDGFTIDIRTWTVPTVGICVSYAETQNSHSRESLVKVINHALAHEGYVGGWLDTESGLYYFDSNRLFPEDSLDAAIQFGKENGQQSIYVLSTGEGISLTD